MQVHSKNVLDKDQIDLAFCASITTIPFTLVKEQKDSMCLFLSRSELLC